MFTFPFLAIPLDKGGSNLVIFPNATGLLYRLDRVPLECQVNPDEWLEKHPEIQPVVQLYPNGDQGLKPFPLDGSNAYNKALEQFEKLKKAKIASLYHQRFFSLEIAIAAMVSTLRNEGGKRVKLTSLDAFYCLFDSSKTKSRETRELLGIDAKTWDKIENDQLEPLAIHTNATPIYSLPVAEQGQLKAVADPKATAKTSAKTSAKASAKKSA